MKIKFFSMIKEAITGSSYQSQGLKEQREETGIIKIQKIKGESPWSPYSDF